MRAVVSAALVALGALAPAALPAQAEALPRALSPPAGERLVLEAHAVGVQIYQCAAGTDGAWQWTLLAPDAELRDAKGALVIRHGAGPSWTHVDGSRINGKLTAKVAAPDASAIPWLLLTVSAREGHGVLEHVTSVQRLHTSGGVAPASGCSAADNGAKVSVPYRADYRFFAPPG
jgi:hypothetical protein